MTDCLNQDKPEQFKKYAHERAFRGRDNEYRYDGELHRGITISFNTFIGIIYKYCISAVTAMSKVNLDAKIVPSANLRSHVLFIWGIRDIGIRDGKGPKYLKGYQEGVWSCELEQALRIGILSEQIEEFRKNLCLREEDGELDTSFFKVWQSFEKGL
ncbi:MAG: hypothetical protein ABSB91_01710 [Sedimentisphaerales bacterium]